QWGLLLALLALLVAPIAAQADGVPNAVRAAQVPLTAHPYDPFEEIGWMAHKANSKVPVILNPGISSVDGGYFPKTNNRFLRVRVWDPCDGPALNTHSLEWLELTPKRNRISLCDDYDVPPITVFQTSQSRTNLLRRIFGRFMTRFIRASGCLVGHHVRFKGCPKYPMPSEIGAFVDGAKIAWPGRCVHGVGEMIIHTPPGAIPFVEVGMCKGPNLKWDVEGRVVPQEAAPEPELAPGDEEELPPEDWPEPDLELADPGTA
ncbi:MAG TPA: hypothetical protein VMR98_04525, partial [Candidatus Polarisedimenticolaceae bacterium]|nr:hypothetical protein [Candidatus Polarisedimenticolaceae bacterium]